MSSYCYGGKVLMKPAEEENKNEIHDEGYPFSYPKVYLEGFYEDSTDFLMSFDAESIIFVRGKRVVEYTDVSSQEALGKDENGHEAWLDGYEYSRTKEEAYPETRVVHEYRIEEYDIDKMEKKRYKVVLEDVLPIDVYTSAMLEELVGEKVPYREIEPKESDNGPILKSLQEPF